MNMSLQELSYINVKRTDEAAGRSLPPPPYNFRPRTMAQRNPETGLHTLTLAVPGRDDWVSSFHLKTASRPRCLCSSGSVVFSNALPCMKLLM